MYMQICKRGYSKVILFLGKIHKQEVEQATGDGGAKVIHDIFWQTRGRP